MAPHSWRQSPADTPGSCPRGSSQMGGPPRAMSAVSPQAQEMEWTPSKPCGWFSLLTETLPDTSADLAAFHLP